MILGYVNKFLVGRWYCELISIRSFTNNKSIRRILLLTHMSIEGVIMGGRAQLVEKSITELLLQHLDNESIGQLLIKAPLKQGMSILASASNIARNKSIQNLLVNKNLKYVIHILESGQFNVFVQGNYENATEKVTLDEFRVHLKETNGLALDYLLYLISTDKIDSVVSMFNGNPVEVKQLSEFLKAEGFSGFRFHRRQEPEIESKDLARIELESQINKWKNENQRLQKKMDREVSKVERESENQVILLKKEQLEKSDKLTKIYESEITNLRTELIRNQRDLKQQISKNEKLEQSVLKLKDDLEIQLNLQRPSVLVVGNLPENSIIDSEKYRISAIAQLDSSGDDIISENPDLIKVYVQSEYVSTERYLEIKKRYPKIPMLYMSREKMKKGN